MHVLQLVTNEDAPFFRQQIRSLESLGITSDIVSPNGTHSATESRSITAYARMTSQVATSSTDSYDLIHANYGLTAPAALVQRSTPTVLSLWGSDLLGSMGPLSRYCATKVDEVIVMTSSMAEELPVSSHIIPHGIDMELFRPLPQMKVRERVGWESTGRHILFPYGPERRIKDFPKAASVVASVRTKTDEPIYLHTLSNVPHEEMPYYYNASDLVLITSRREGSPNSVREALACNQPVVATNVGDIALHLDPVRTSHVCDSHGELIDRVLDSLRISDEPTGRMQAKTNSADAMAKKIKAVYMQAVS